MTARGSTNFLDSLLVHLMSRWWTLGVVRGSAGSQVIMRGRGWEGKGGGKVISDKEIGHCTVMVKFIVRTYAVVAMQ